MDFELLLKVPRKYFTIIKAIHKDEDGYWCVISSTSGYRLVGYKSEFTIHEEDFEKFKEAFKFIKKDKKQSSKRK